MDGSFAPYRYEASRASDPGGPPPGRSAAYGGQTFGQSPGGAGPYDFSHSVPYGFVGGCAAGPFPGNPYCTAGTFPAFSGPFTPGPPSYDLGQVTAYEQEPGVGLHRGGLSPGGHGAAEPEDERAAQRRLDARWLQRFSRSRQARSSPRPPSRSSPALREALYRTVRHVRELQACCDTLQRRMLGGEWDEAYRRADRVLKQLCEGAPGLSDEAPGLLDRTPGVSDEAPGLLDRTPGLLAEASSAARRRRRRLRARTLRLLQRRQAEERRSEREAAVSAWRIKRTHEVEEKKKEKELKLAADSVLCEVRKKQADLKRMQDVLKALEKLRRLRKEAASRRGIGTEQQCDGQFSLSLEELRSMQKRRTVLYSAEEKALMVMLEGEQEGERQREQDRRVKKETERRLQRRRTADALLFGEECPADFVLQPFTQYYTQAQHSLHALIQLRKEWDVFLVAAHHPNSSAVPTSWIFPEPPSDEAWASALQPVDHLST